MLANRRCVIPAEGFYEWREEGGNKQPYFFHRKDGKPLMFAGIWDYSEVKGDAVPSFAILTDEPNALVAPYHDRMPVVLDDVAGWIDLDTPLDAMRPPAWAGAISGPLRQPGREQGLRKEHRCHRRHDVLSVTGRDPGRSSAGSKSRMAAGLLVSPAVLSFGRSAEGTGQ